VALGSPEQVARWLDDTDRVWALASTEADPAAHLGWMATTARREGSAFVLNGEKLCVFNADRADRLVVLARSADGEGLAGIEAFVVETKAPGVQIGLEDRMGLRAGRPCRVQLEGVAGERLDGAADTAAALTRLFDIGRVVNAARMVGAARGAMGFAVDYAQDRKAFGKPICAHQGLAFFIADMEVALESARNLVLKAAWQLDSGADATVASCNAAICACEAAVKVTVDAVQVFGGAGFMKDMPVERYMRDVRTLGNALGTPEDHVAVLGEALYGPQSMSPAGKDSSKKVAQA
jgi:butyryl-CoA dehydrogenase